MSKRFRRMSETEIKLIISELDRWALGHLGSKLTWAMLEKRFGFSRQALQAKHEIKAAYDNAKAALSGGLVQTKEQTTKQNEELICLVSRLQKELEHYKAQELLWKQRWQRIAFHVRSKGIQMQDVDKPITGNSDHAPDSRETNNILKLFDKNIPPSGRI